MPERRALGSAGYVLELLSVAALRSSDRRLALPEGALSLLEPLRPLVEHLLPHSFGSVQRGLPLGAGALPLCELGARGLDLLLVRGHLSGPGGDDRAIRLELLPLTFEVGLPLDEGRVLALGAQLVHLGSQSVQATVPLHLAIELGTDVFELAGPLSGALRRAAQLILEPLDFTLQVIDGGGRLDL